MVENFDNAELFEGIYRNLTAGIATVPFSFHRFPTKLGHERNVTGDIIYREVYDYYFKESNAYDAWPAWEMNDYDTLQVCNLYNNGPCVCPYVRPPLLLCYPLLDPDETWYVS